MNSDILKNKKLWIVIGIGLTIIIAIVVFVLFSNKNVEEEIVNNQNVASTTSSEKKSKGDSKKTWPDLDEYEIVDLNDGKIENVQNNGDINGYKLNYSVEVESITKDDIDNYVDQFKDWEVNKDDNGYILVKVENDVHCCIVIKFDENENKANFVITAI